jgi:hypothetical protein
MRGASRELLTADGNQGRRDRFTQGRRSPMTDQQPVLNPGDDAPEGDPGVGENLCRACSGSGQLAGGAECPTCGGTGIVEEGIGGG